MWYITEYDIAREEAAKELFHIIVCVISLLRRDVKNSVVLLSNSKVSRGFELAQKPVLETLDSKFPLQLPLNLFSNIK